LGQVIPHVACWREFIVGGVGVGLISTTFAPLVDLYALVLERMVMDCYLSDERIVMELFSVGAPLLSSVELVEKYIRPPHDNTAYYFAIKSCGLQKLNHIKFSQLMSHKPRLTYLSIDPNLVSAKSIHHHPPVELPYILWLKLTSINASILAFLRLPTLECLVVNDSTVNVIQAFTHHNRLYPTLRSLKLVLHSPHDKRDIVFAETTLDFMSLFPNVGAIAFYGADPMLILHALSNDNNPQVMDNPNPHWPRLSTITLLPLSADPVPCWMKPFNNITNVVWNQLLLGCPVR
jgi:hypothetical protein